MARYKVIITIVEEGSDDLGLCCVSSWRGVNELVPEAHRLVDRLGESVGHHDKANEGVKRG